MNFEPQIIEVGIEEVIPNRFQPRLTFDEQAMEDLASSIKEHGIIQPLVLRRVGDKYEIIAGERRYKAAIMAGLQKVPAIITNLDDNSSAEVALVENVQRKALTPIEEAKSYKVLLDRGYITQDELAKRIGVSQPTVANRLRLLNLDEEVQKALLEEKISERHARSMLKIQDVVKQKELLKRTIDERWTVKQLDDAIQGIIGGEGKMDDTPLVEIAPSIDQIKTMATDLNPQKVAPGIEEMLKPEFQMNGIVSEVKPSESITIPSPVDYSLPPIDMPSVPEAPLPVFDNQMPQVDPMISNSAPTPTLEERPREATPNKFFNFLEDEEANMNIVDKPIMPPSPTPVVEENVPSSSDVEILDIPSVPLSMENVVDPVSKIDTLSPSYVEPVIEDENKAFDLKDAINTLRETVKAIEAKGLLIDTEEIDLENLYQIIIKIDKKTE